MRKAENDKSKFFETAGYNLDNWRILERHIRENILPLEAVPTKKTLDGQKYEIEGMLPGVNGVKLRTYYRVDERGNPNTTYNCDSRSDNL